MDIRYDIASFRKPFFLVGSAIIYRCWLVSRELLLYSDAKSKFQSSSGALALKLEKVAPDYRNSLGHYWLLVDSRSMLSLSYA